VKGSGDELVLFLTPPGDQVIDALAARYCVAVLGDEGPAAKIEQCGFRRAHLVGRGIAALDFFVRRSDLVQSLVLAEAEPEDPADYRSVFELIDVPLLLLNPNSFLTAMHAAVPMSQLLTIDLDDPRAFTRALWSHLLRARALETQTLTPSLTQYHSRSFISTSVAREATGDSVLVPHDDVAIAMAQGHRLISGRMQTAVTKSAPKPALVPDPGPVPSSLARTEAGIVAADVAARGVPVLRLHLSDRVAGLVLLARAVQGLRPRPDPAGRED